MNHRNLDLPSLESAVKKVKEKVYSLKELLACVSRKLPKDVTKENLTAMYELAIEELKEGRFSFNEGEDLLFISLVLDSMGGEQKSTLKQPAIKRFLLKIATEMLNSEQLYRHIIKEKDENGHLKEIEYFKSMSLEEEEKNGKV